MDVTTVIQAVFGLIAVVFTSVVVPYIKSKTNTEQQNQLNLWIKLAVESAEQYMSSASGSEKKDYVLNFLTENGLEADLEKLDTLIEAGVYELRQGAIK